MINKLKSMVKLIVGGMEMNIDELKKKKKELEELRLILEEKENNGEIVRAKHRVYKIGKNLEIIDTKETRIQEVLEENCDHPILWQVNYNRSNLEYYDPNIILTHYWYYCMQCGKLITDKIKPETDNIITAPDDVPYVFFIRKKLIPELQSQYSKILNESLGNEITIEEVNEIINKKLSKQKIKTL